MLPGVLHLRSLAEVTELVEAVSPVYVRFSAGPVADAATVSRDHESGCLLPGLSVNPLTPEPWWDRKLEHWLARQLCQYAHLLSADRYPWVLTGQIAGRGPDCEPLLVDTTVVGTVDPAVVDEAAEVYARVFRPGDDGR
jgi:hypothetical protein